VNNAVKYSNCGQIQAIIAQKANLLTMTIRDDGTGFDATKSASGNGLLNMQKRTKAHGGTFQLSSVPGKGTEIIVSLPV
jgi:signal transduction histidine kinase